MDPQENHHLEIIFIPNVLFDKGFQIEKGHSILAYF